MVQMLRNQQYGTVFSHKNGEDRYHAAIFAIVVRLGYPRCEIVRHLVLPLGLCCHVHCETLIQCPEIIFATRHTGHI